MFPLSCARVSAHIGRENSAHKKTWSAHTFSFKNVLAHISYIEISAGKNVAHRNFFLIKTNIHALRLRKDDQRRPQFIPAFDWHSQSMDNVGVFEGLL